MDRAWLTTLFLAFTTFVASPVIAQEAETNAESNAPSDTEVPEDTHESVESAEHLSSSFTGATEGDPVASAEGPIRRLIFVAEGRESLLPMLELQLPNWRIRQVNAAPTYLRVHRAQAQLMPSDAVVWLEQSDDVERVVLLEGAGDSPRSSALPPADAEDWARTFALVVEGLIREQVIAARERAVERPQPTTCIEDGIGLWGTFVEERGTPRRERPQRRDWWPTPLARDGWIFRYGWTHGFAPRRSVGSAGNYSRYDYPSGGLRIAAGHWLHRNVRVSLIGEFAWAKTEPEGVLGLQAMVLSSTRFRMGAGVEVAGLMVSEDDDASGDRFGWFGLRIGLPLEMGLEVNRKGGIFFHIGPTWTKAPYATTMHPGYQMSMEWEFN